MKSAITSKNAINLTRTLLLHINGLFPFLFPMRHIFKNFNFFHGIYLYYKDALNYNNQDKQFHSDFPLIIANSYPMFYDRFEDAGEIPKHYFHMDLWAARRIFKSGVKKHYDIGSRLDSFISHCLVFCDVVMLDVRPLTTKIQGLNFIQADAMNMKDIRSNSIQSLSTLHAIEHFGLGRYGDPIDVMGYKRAIEEMKRIIKKGGHLYFATPVGRQRLEFNAHRVFNPKYIVSLFDGFTLKEFSAIDDKNNFIENADINKFVNANYSCGLYLFVKNS